MSRVQRSFRIRTYNTKEAFRFQLINEAHLETLITPRTFHNSFDSIDVVPWERNVLGLEFESQGARTFEVGIGNPASFPSKGSPWSGHTMRQDVTPFTGKGIPKSSVFLCIRDITS
jgi:hypothetical protein